MSVVSSRPASFAAGNQPGSILPDRSREVAEVLAVVRALAVESIEADPLQPRKTPDAEAIERLARSLASHGQLQPILVRPGRVPGRFVIVTGERRWRAAVRAGLTTVNAVVLNMPLERSHLLELQLVENLLREDLNPLDQAEAFRSLMDGRGWSGAELARALHVSESTISRALALLTLPEPIQEEVAAGRVAPSVARELGRVNDPFLRDALTEQAATRGLSRSDVRAVAGGKPGKVARPVAGTGAAAPRCQVLTFEVRAGKVTVELYPPGGEEAALDAVLDVSELLMDALHYPREDEEKGDDADGVCDPVASTPRPSPTAAPRRPDSDDDPRWDQLDPSDDSDDSDESDESDDWDDDDSCEDDDDDNDEPTLPPARKGGARVAREPAGEFVRSVGKGGFPFPAGPNLPGFLRNASPDPNSPAGAERFSSRPPGPVVRLEKAVFAPSFPDFRGPPDPLVSSLHRETLEVQGSL